jgi:hypothetical protein
MVSVTYRQFYVRKIELPYIHGVCVGPTADMDTMARREAAVRHPIDSKRAIEADHSAALSV